MDQNTFAMEKGGLESNDNVEMLGMIAHDKIEDNLVNIAGEGDIDESVDHTNGKKRRIGIVFNIFINKFELPKTSLGGGPSISRPSAAKYCPPLDSLQRAHTPPKTSDKVLDPP